VSSSPFEGEALERLRLAAAEIAFLTGRGYDAGEVKALVAKTRALSSEQLALLDRGVCSELQYRARAAKEMLPEDIARRPLLVDGHDVVDAVTTALAGGFLLEGLDQTVQPLEPGGAPDRVDTALERIGPILREMRPSKTRWLLAEGRADAPGLKDKLVASAKKWKVPVEVEILADPKASMRRAASAATSDPSLIEASKSWCNLSGPVVATLDGVRRVKLQ
jgi:hypothetical protein